MKFLAKIILLGMLVINGLQAQDSLSVNDLEQQILSYEETDLEIVAKSRKMIFDKLKAGDYQKVEELMVYLAAKFDTTAIIPLWHLEKQLLFYWLGNYGAVLDSVRAFKEENAYYDSGKKLAPPADMLYSRIRNLSLKNYDERIAGIAEHNAMEFEKEFLALFLDYLLFDNDDVFISREELNSRATAYIENYPGSPFNYFTRHYIRFVFEPSKWGFGFAFFSGVGSFSGRLSDYFENNITLGHSFDIYYKNFAIYLRNYIGVAGKTKTAFRYKGDWKDNLKLNVYLPELSFGYALVENDVFRVTPFAGISSMSITPPPKVREETGNDVSLDFVTTYTTGLNLDIKMGESKIPLVAYNERGYWFLRFRIGYNKPTYEKRDTRFSGEMLYINVGIGGFARKIARVL